MINIQLGDCVELMRGMEENWVDSIITDPPYGISLMGKEWDSFSDNEAFQEWTRQWAVEALRVTKPGGHLLCFGSPRTYHRIACGIEDAGWELKDCCMWLYASGFSKGRNIGKDMDRFLGNKRKVIAERRTKDFSHHKGSMLSKTTTEDFATQTTTIEETQGSSEWEGYNTTLSPSYEPIILAMKPREGTYLNNALKYGVAGLNVGACRIGISIRDVEESTGEKLSDNASMNGGNYSRKITGTVKGRWPKNVIMDEETGRMLDEQTGGVEKGGFVRNRTDGAKPFNNDGKDTGYVTEEVIEEKSAGKSRFYYCPKANKSEKNAGLDHLEDKDCGVGALRDGGRENTKPAKNVHPSVKPIALMEYLVTLIAPPKNAIILDPFLGSGSSGIACVNLGLNFIGFDKEEEYIEIAKARIDHALKNKS